MKKLVPIFATIGGIGILVIAAVIVRLFAPAFMVTSLTRTEDGLKRVAAEANKGLPKMVDKETRLNRVSASGRTLIYDYDMPNYRASDMDLKVFHDHLLPSVRDKSCTLKDARQMFLENGDTLRYHYVDKSGEDLDTIEIALADCKAAGL